MSGYVGESRREIGDAGCLSEVNEICRERGPRSSGARCVLERVLCGFAGGTARWSTDAECLSILGEFNTKGARGVWYVSPRPSGEGCCSSGRSRCSGMSSDAVESLRRRRFGRQPPNKPPILPVVRGTTGVSGSSSSSSSSSGPGSRLDFHSIRSHLHRVQMRRIEDAYDTYQLGTRFL